MKKNLLSLILIFLTGMTWVFIQRPPIPTSADKTDFLLKLDDLITSSTTTSSAGPQELIKIFPHGLQPIAFHLLSRVQTQSHYDLQPSCDIFVHLRSIRPRYPPRA